MNLVVHASEMIVEQMVKDQMEKTSFQGCTGELTIDVRLMVIFS